MMSRALHPSGAALFTRALYRTHRAGLMRSVSTLAVVPAVLGVLGASCAEPTPPSELAALYDVAVVPRRGIELETELSRVRIRDAGTVRSLYFVAEGDREVVESRMDLARPEVLALPYTRSMFASYLFVPEPESVLLVGLGAGSMVRFLAHHDPQVRVDVVEIDRGIAEIAEEYFGTRPGGGGRFQIADGYTVLRTAEERWDVILMDAFLAPSEETDRTGVPRRLKEVPFYEALRRRLEEGGVAVFNLHGHPKLDEDVEGLRRAFGPVAVFDTRGSNNVIVVGTREGTLPERRILERRADDADERLAPAGWSFRDLLDEIDH